MASGDHHHYDAQTRVPEGSSHASGKLSTVTQARGSEQGAPDLETVEGVAGTRCNLVMVTMTCPGGGCFSIESTRSCNSFTSWSKYLLTVWCATGVWGPSMLRVPALGTIIYRTPTCTVWPCAHTAGAQLGANLPVPGDPHERDSVKN